MKGNQPTLYQGLMDFFVGHMEDDFAGVSVSRHETDGKAHGRTDHRSYYVCDIPADLADAKRWAGMVQVGVAISDTRRGGKSCDDVRYYILSRRLSARRFGTLVRSYWGIESMHRQLDVSFGENQSRVRKDHASANLGALRRTSLSLLRNESDNKLGIKNKRLTAAWDTDYLRKVLFGI